MKTLLPFEKIKRSVLTKIDSETDPNYGIDPKKRPISELLDYGIINIDKPKGPTSHQVSGYVKEILGLKKAGHSGTLDPGVTGVLPVAIGRATRIVQTLLPAGKEYVALMHLHDDYTENQIKAKFQEFTGKIKQLPPVRSAVKRASRFRKIYYFEFIEKEDQDVLFKVGCQAGTYIRKLIHDMGLSLGSGAHMAELRRTKAGPFKDQKAVTLQDLTDAMHYYKNENKEQFLRSLIQPIEAAIAHLPKVWVLDSTVDNLCHGASLHCPGIARIESEIQTDETIAVLSLKDELVCLGTSKMTSKQILESPKGLAIKTAKVFMNPQTYPKPSNTKTI